MNFSQAKFEHLAEEKISGKKGTVKIPNLERQPKNSYARLEFEAVERRPHMNVIFKRVGEIVNAHRNLRKARFGEYERRKKIKQKIRCTIKWCAANGWNIDQCINSLAQEFGEEVDFRRHYPKPKIGFEFRDINRPPSNEVWF